MEVQSSKEDKKCAPEVKLKSLPSHLIYEFLDPNYAFPIIFSAKFDGTQLEKLLDVLRKHRRS